MPKFEQVGDHLPRIEVIADATDQPAGVLEARGLAERMDVFTGLVDTVINETVISTGLTYEQETARTARNIATWRNVTGVDETSFARYNHLRGEWF